MSQPENPLVTKLQEMWAEVQDSDDFGTWTSLVSTAEKLVSALQCWDMLCWAWLGSVLRAYLMYKLSCSVPWSSFVSKHKCIP